MNIAPLMPMPFFGLWAFFWIFVGFFIASGLLMWLWNITIPEVFGLRKIQYWQAFRLWVIAALLFGAGRML